MKLIRVTLVFLTLLYGHGLAVATHIVGGDFYYKRIGTNYYEITMKVYIDCVNGNDSAISSDKTALIGVFNAGNNQFVESFIMTRTGPVRLNKRQYSCVVPELEICVDEYTYVKNVFLDPGVNGIILAFQRCCRNNTINNIVTPESTGATYWVKIPGTKFVSSDNSPVFKELPPNYLCAKAPLVFDHSAVDADGDSLVYELYQPFLGASRDQPRPDNGADGYQDNPPFKNLIWQFPYSTNNQMAGQPIMQIDSKTGELTVTPSVLGQFVIGIKVKEYRDGVLIGETLRDYQFNVRDCKFDLISVFFAPIYSCSDTVVFENKSYKAVDYYWDFGDPTRTNDSSRLANPSWVYPGNGDYRVSLRAKNSICEDVYSTTVKIRSKINLNIGPDLYNCKPANRFISTRLFDVTSTLWSTGEKFPNITISNPGTYWARVFYGSCTAIDTMVLSYYPVKFSGPNDTVFCDSVRGTLTVVGDANQKYRWNNSPKDSFTSLLINKPGVYTVRVNNGPCIETDTINIWISGKPKIGPYFFVCNEFNKTIDAGDFVPPATYQWSDGSTNRFLNINKQGNYWVKVMQGLCTNMDNLMVENPIIPLDLGPDRHFCDTVSLLLTAPLYMESYLWSDQSILPDLLVSNEGKYWVEVFDTNGCQKADTIEIDVTKSPMVFAGNDTTICYRSVVHLGTMADYTSYLWNTGSSKRKIVIQTAGNFILVVTDSLGCTGADTVRVKVDPNALPNELFIPNAFSPNDDGLNEYFPYTESVIQPEFALKIFNRWGEKLFDSNTSNEDHWNGVYLDGVIRPDAFLYLVEYRGCDGDYRRKYGTVTVLK